MVVAGLNRQHGFNFASFCPWQARYGGMGVANHKKGLAAVP